MARDEYMMEFDENFQNDRLLNTARLGIEASRFFAGPVGKHVIAKSEEQIEEAYKRLSVENPDDAGAIRQHQFDIAVARAIPTWLATAITNGLHAERQIEEEEATD